MASLKELRLLEKVWSSEMHAPIKDLYTRVQNTGLFSCVQQKSKLELCFLLTVAQFELNLAWKNVSASQALLRKFIDAAEAEEKKHRNVFAETREGGLQHPYWQKIHISQRFATKTPFISCN